MQFLDLIIKKRNGLRLSKAEIDFFISAYVSGEIADYQVAALLMAICFSRMDDQETAELTFAMRDSGETIDLGDIPGPLADKHSTGGVADTTTLITAPIVAACGLKVAKMSGRGLGHTGGTIDKLESIPGLITAIEMSRFKEIVRSCNLSIIAQTADLVPADKLLYALRDVTGTIDDLSLISASIMSKKLACGSDTIVLDVKTGNGAFMKTKAEAEQLARTMVTIGQMAGKNTMALVTDMNQPLGNAVGNSLEVQEAIEILQGDHHGDLRQLSCQLAAEMLLTSAVADDQKEADRMVTASIDSGKALKHFAAMIKAQGGDPRVCEDISLLPRADQRISITAPEEGYISEIATDEIGMAAMLLGAGRASKTDIIDPAVGIWLKKRRGDHVARGEQLALFHINNTSRLEQAKQRFLGSLRFGPKPLVNPLIYSRITPEKGERCDPRP
jgi:pyrimidine-nucleoside phosphorylase